MRINKRWQFLASVFALVPLVVLIVVGILILVSQRAAIDVTFGVLILVFCALLLAGTVLLVVALGRQADVARLQADFLSKVSHDFRTPLTSIRMFVETLRENRVEDGARRERILSLLAQETERLSTLIDRLLEFARLESGQLRFVPKPVDLGEVVRSVVARFEPRTLQGDVQLTATVAPSLPLLLADADALAEIVQNLLDNAFKYTGPHKRIAVEVKGVGRDVELAVTDNGPGVARVDQNRIFDSFYRVDDRLSRATEGAGLGLALTRHIVHAHGGRIRVESDPGAGARFVVVLPALTGGHDLRARRKEN